jgi:acetyl-CoA carboxylase carboxyl transferase subunit alpha
MLQHSYYSVISPEGCAGILWKSHEFAPNAAAALRFTSKDLPGLDVVDDVIPEPLGGAHRDHQQMAIQIKQYLVSSLRELQEKSMDDLVADRYQKFRKIGRYLET